MQSNLVKDTQHCWVCNSPHVETHHAIHGQGRRQIAENYKMLIPLCHEHHMRLHDHGEFDEFFKCMAQEWYEKNIGTREEFREEFGKSWL